MRIPLALVNQFLTPALTGAQAAQFLTRRGIETEYLAQRLDGIVVGEIISIRAHPNAERLRLALIDYGSTGPLEIVCGADNIAVGQKVPLALVGARLNAFTVTAKKIRGIESKGMLLSQKEIGIGNESGGIYILSPDEKTGTPFEITRMLEVDTKSPRHDILGAYGLAREISVKAPVRLARLTNPLEKKIPIGFPIARGGASRLDVLLAEINDIIIPHEISQLIEHTGLNRVHPIVDILNLTMLATGQSAHAYDRDLLSELLIKSAAKKQSFEALDGEQYQIQKGDLIVTSGHEVLSLAGIIGARQSAVTFNTKRVVIELATFAPGPIAHTSIRLNLQTASSLRFRRGADTANVDRALGYLIPLLNNIGVRIEGYETISSTMRKRTVPFHPETINALLGTRIGESRMRTALKKIGCEVGNASVNPPSYRGDIEHNSNLAEEIARDIGYEQIPQIPLTIEAASPQHNPLYDKGEYIRSLAVASGFSEILTTSFVKTGVVMPENVPTGKRALRSDFAEGHLKAMSTLGQSIDNPMIFEIGTIFQRDSEHPSVMFTTTAPKMPVLQQLRTQLCGLGSPSTEPASSEFDQLASYEWKQNSGKICLGYLAQPPSHTVKQRPPIAALKIELSALPEQPIRILSVHESSLFPVSVFDVSFFTGRTLFHTIQTELDKRVPEQVRTYYVIDSFSSSKGESITIRFELDFKTHTPTQKELAHIQTLILEIFKTIKGITLR